MDRRWLLAAGVAAVSILAGLWWGRGVHAVPASDPLPTTERVSVPSDTTRGEATAPLVVHVSGWVAEPGLVTLGAGARVGDAVAAAGGSLPGASLDGLNLASAVSDGEQVVVPGPDAEPAPSVERDGAGGEAGGLVDINTASPSQLETLPGIGPVIAERIVSHRESSGRFENVEDLLDVPGIGESKLASIRDLVEAR